MTNLKKETGAVSLTQGLRLYLYLTAATTGAAILIVEILGAKMLAPYFGTSHFVWTAQITATLLALAVGYYLGGWFADRSQSLGRLYTFIIGAALYLAIVVRICEPMAYACLKFKLALGSLCASLLFFFVPLTLLATVGPYVIRALTLSVQAVGGQVGRLSAISTLGSVAGCLLIGYVLIPNLPNSVTMLVTAGILILISLIYFVVWGWDSRDKVAGQIGIILTILAGIIAARHQITLPGDYWIEVVKQNSSFGQMQVIQTVDGDRRYYLNDFLTQNTYDPNEKKSISLFTYMLKGLAEIYTPKIERVLCIGMGVGIVPMAFAHEGVKVDVVEINPSIVPLATRFFNFEPDKVSLTIGDGRHYLTQTPHQYDAIILDAFLGDSSPSHLITQQSFTSMKKLLKPEGVLVMNSFSDFKSGKDFFCGSLFKTMSDVFKSVVIHDGDNGNVFFVASAKNALERMRQPNLQGVHSHCFEEVKSTYDRFKKPDASAGIILTDDYNPVDFFDAKNRESLRTSLAWGMRGK